MRRTSTRALIRFTRWLGIVFVAAGFAVVGLGWNGMARVTCVDCQLPYLLSAGATGVGLVVVGVGLLVIAQMRVERIRLSDQLEQLRTPTRQAVEPDDTVVLSSRGA